MFDVKRSTLCDHFHGKHLKKLGKPQAVVPEVEDAIATMLDQVAEWGFPVGRFELKLIIKNIRHNHCQDVSCFRDNTPGDDWINNFIKRNQMSKRAASNIKRSHADIDAEITQ